MGDDTGGHRECGCWRAATRDAGGAGRDEPARGIHLAPLYIEQIAGRGRADAEASRARKVHVRLPRGRAARGGAKGKARRVRGGAVILFGDRLDVDDAVGPGAAGRIAAKVDVADSLPGAACVPLAPRMTKRLVSP